jgi:hypothetical protein
VGLLTAFRGELYRCLAGGVSLNLVRDLEMSRLSGPLARYGSRRGRGGHGERPGPDAEVCGLTGGVRRAIRRAVLLHVRCRRQRLRAPERRQRARGQAGFWPMVMAGAPAGVGTVRTDVSPALRSSWHAAASSIGVPP